MSRFERVAGTTRSIQLKDCLLVEMASKLLQLLRTTFIFFGVALPCIPTWILLMLGSDTDPQVFWIVGDGMVD